MYYTLTESQANLVATDFKHLIGQPLNKNISLLIEDVTPKLMTDGTWQVDLETYLGDKEEWSESAGHSKMTSNLFYYLADNNLIDSFVAEKYGLSSP